MPDALAIIKDTALTYSQKVSALARHAESSIDVLAISPRVRELRQQKIICDLFEGHAPYRPRYIVPDYSLFMQRGSEFLGLTPPQNLADAVDNLLVLYRHVPSITSFPVFIGNLDTLLEPFTSDDENSYLTIKRFLRHIDRTVTDSFCHGNLGPHGTVAARHILRAQRELMTAVPNLTLKYSRDTDEALVIDAIQTALEVAKPSFANDELFRQDFGGDYAIVSCYNGLPIGGGSFTLVRLNLSELVKICRDADELRSTLLPEVVRHMLSYMDERVRFVVEEARYFENNFLLEEGLIDPNKFTAMFGVVGLAECVNALLGNPARQEDRFGYSEAAQELGLQLIADLSRLVSSHTNRHLIGTHGRYLLHAQVGIDTDINTSPGCRIPIGEEPHLYEHIMQSAPFHKFFPSGIGDVFSFDSTYQQNPQAVMDIMRGAFRHGLRYFSAYSEDSDVVRITGYLVKRSEIEQLAKGKPVLNGAVVLGKGAVENQGVLRRRTRTGNA